MVSKEDDDQIVLRSIDEDLVQDFKKERYTSNSLFYFTWTRKIKDFYSHDTYLGLS